MRVRIQAIVEGSNKPVFDFAGPSITIGRDAGCDLPMTGTSNVSGRHAQIALAPDGASLVDLGSTNGTFLNDRRIEGSKKLRKGDYFRLGQTGPSFQVVELDLSGAAQPPAPAFMGTMRERAADPLEAFEREAEHRAPAPRPPTAKPRPAPEPAEPATAVRPVPHASGQTRLMVVELQKKNRKLMVGVGSAVLAFLLIGGMTGLYFLWKTHQQEARQKEQEDLQKKQDAKIIEADKKLAKVEDNAKKKTEMGEGQLYEQVLRSAVWIRAKNAKGGGWAGSGSLIDSDNRLVLTCEHVANETATHLTVLFPARDPDGKLITQSNTYVTNIKGWGLGARLVKADAKRDLAVIQLEKLPEGVIPMRLAKESVHPQQSIFCLGGSPAGNEQGMWISSHGRVRQVYKQVWNYGDGKFREAFLISSDVSTNSGDSGGPIYDLSGVLVGVNIAGDRKSDQNRMHTDIREILDFLPHCYKMIGKTWQGP